GLALRGRVSIAGSVGGPPEAPRFALTARVRRLALRGVGLGDVTMRTDFADERLKLDLRVRGGLVEQMHVGLAAGLHLDLRAGEVAPRWAPPPRVDLQLDRLDLARAAAFAPGLAMAGRLDAKGRFAGAKASGRLDMTGRSLLFQAHAIGDLDVALGNDGRTLDAAVTLASPLADRVAVTAKVPVEVALDRGAARWRSDAAHALEVTLAGLRLPDVMAAVGGPPVDGVVDLSLGVDGPATRPAVQVQTQARSLAWQTLTVGDLDAKAAVRDGKATVEVGLTGPLAESLRLTAYAPVRLAPLGRKPVDWNAAGPHGLDFDLVGVQLADFKEFHHQEGLAGRVDVSADLEGSAVTPRLEVQVTAREARYADRPAGDLVVTTLVDPQTARLGLRWQAPGEARVQLDAEVPVALAPTEGMVAWRSEASHRLDLTVAGLDRAALAPFVSVPPRVEPRVDLKLQAAGNERDFNVTADLGGTVGLPEAGLVPLTGRIELSPTAQMIRLSSPLVGQPLEVQVDAEAPVAALRDGTASVLDIPFVVKLALPEFDIAALAPLMPPGLYQPRGALTLRVDASGTAAAPQLDAEVRLTDGALTLVDLNQHLNHVQLDVGITADKATLRKLEARSGKGRLSGKGEVAREGDGARGQVRIDLSQWPILKPGVPRGVIKGRIDTELALAKSAVDVKVAIRDMGLRLIGSNVPAPKPVARNENIERTDLPQKAVTEEKSAGNLRVIVELVDPIYIRGAGADMQWDGRLVLGATEGNSEVEGALRSVEGSFGLLGREFILTHGRVYMPKGGGNMPYLDVIATCQVDEYEVTATIRGKPTRPTLELSSDPPLPDYAVLSLLVIGAPD
ncbi:MAG: translocation/assembly module TamB domain-containing protein, partial [Myxococcales bacterium]|nr:translocation/assembly module TamB domain-containing protein [Myxococcales bacterium]